MRRFVVRYIFPGFHVAFEREQPDPSAVWNGLATDRETAVMAARRWKSGESRSTNDAALLRVQAPGEVSDPQEPAAARSFGSRSLSQML
jgi:hypothetical protein